MKSLWRMSILGCTVKALNNHNNNMVTLPALKWPIAPFHNTMQNIFLLFVQILSWIFLVMGGKYKKNTILTRIFLSRHFKTFQEDAGATSIKLKRDLYILCTSWTWRYCVKLEAKNCSKVWLRHLLDFIRRCIVNKVPNLNSSNFPVSQVSGLLLPHLFDPLDLFKFYFGSSCCNVRENFLAKHQTFLLVKCF